jgi:hypothetical protein
MFCSLLCVHFCDFIYPFREFCKCLEVSLFMGQLSVLATAAITVLATAAITVLATAAISRSLSS